jgi:two-component system cell cycle sensor histidine kinase/response regulator CckA
MPETRIRILHVEDVPADAELAERELRQAGFELDIRRVETREAFLAALADFAPELILSDYRLPEFDGMQALLLAKEHAPDVPVVITTGSVNEETAVECMKAGAADYVLKEQLGHLGIAVRSALERQRLVVEKRTDEKRIRGLNRLLRTITEVNQLLVRATDEESLLKDVCRILVSHGGYALAWIGRADRETMRVVPVASAGDETGYLQRIEVRWDDSPEGRGPLGIAIRERRSAIVSDVQADPMEVPFRRLHPSPGFGSIAAIPIRRGGAVIEGLIVYSAEEVFIDEEELALLEDLAGDLTFALDALDAREALRRSNVELRKLGRAVEQTPATVMITDLGGRIEYVNPRFTEVTGYTAEEALGQNPRILKSDRTPPEVHRAMWETIAAGRVWQGELCNRKKDGTLFWESASISPVRDEQGVTTSYVAVKEDITDRKRAAEKLAKSEIYFRSLIENAQDVIVVIDAGGDLLFMSPAVERILGRPPEQFVGKNAFEFIHPEDAAGIQAALRRVVDDPELPQTVVFRFRHANGSWRTLEGIGKLLAAEGSPRAVVNVRDVTESRALEERLRQSQKMEAVGRLAGGVAHDFNNLLTVIFGYSDVLLQGLEPGPLHEAMQEVRRASERAAALTRQLLAFSRKQTLVPEVLDLGEVVSSLSTMVERLIGEDIKVRVVVSPDLGRVKADRGQLEQVVMNLAVNARDAMPKGGSLIFELQNVELDDAYTAAHAEVKPGPYALLAISDTGTGMDAETQKRIFEPFFTTKETGKGTGLGLSTVHGIVHQSGGAIDVYSEPGQGTTFKVYLPRFAGDAAVPRPVSAINTALAAGSETVLVIEDEAAIRQLTKLILQKAGYTVLLAESPVAAERIAGSHPGPIHLMLTDVVMPGMRGPELAERLIRARSDLRVLYMSGYTDDAIAHHGFLDAGTEFLQKPFTPLGLTQKIREVLGRGSEDAASSSSHDG